MRFEPAPANDFREFIDLYYGECRRRVPRIAAIAGKWTFEDLIPGLSDFDTRFIVDDRMTVDDWCAMSTAVGEVHLDLCRRYPHWARNLEHLPGINLTWRELCDPRLYYPEYPQWTFYETTDPPRRRAAEATFDDRPWDATDELFHLKKFCLYYGRYDREIDPAINMGPYEGKYPLHSRFMHYFCPPLQSALSILARRPVRGKMEAVRLACDMFGDVPVFRETRDVVERHYEVPALYEEPELTHLEERLAAALEVLRDRLAAVVTLVPDAAGKSVAEWKACLAAIPQPPHQVILDNARFSRLMKGRLRFYAAAPPHFDSLWLIENELRRIRSNFLDAPLRVYWRQRTGERVEDVEPLLSRIASDLWTDEELHCAQEFARLLPGHWADGRQRQLALAIADVFDGFLSAMDKVVKRVQEDLDDRP